MLFPKRFLGIDIGTSYIKIVEISKFGYRRKLENYGEMAAEVLYQKPFRTFEKNTLLLSSQEIARAIRAIIEEAKIKSRQVVFSIPDFSTFFTNFELPPMSKEELPQAIRYEARQYVPLPLGEVTLDWQAIEGRVSEGKKTNFKVLLVAVPKEVINQYREIARISQLELGALEAEVFGLMRSLIKEDEKGLISIVDIGARSTTCNIVEGKNLKISYSFDMSANEFTKVIAKSLNVDYSEAERLKKEYGILTLNSDKEEIAKNLRQILLPLIDTILREIKVIFNNFYQKERKEIPKIILAGGVALLPGLKEYFAENLKKEIEIANPFSGLFYPPILEKTLKEMGPSYAVAVGAALRGLEY
jgi:type IV pilus assembly protein PilM